MNYREMETLFREEQLDLRDELHLNASAADLSRLKKDWLSVRLAALAHQSGGAAGYAFTGAALTLAYLNLHDVYVYGPFLLAAAGLLLNGAFFPIRKPPASNLERFSATELANELAAFQRYANRRISFDCAAVILFMGALIVWYVHLVWGINPLTDFDRIGPIVRTKIAVALALPVLGGVLINYLSNRKLGKLEQRLRGYLEEELV